MHNIGAAEVQSEGTVKRSSQCTDDCQEGWNKTYANHVSLCSWGLWLCTRAVKTGPSWSASCEMSLASLQTTGQQYFRWQNACTFLSPQLVGFRKLPSTAENAVLNRCPIRRASGKLILL